MSLHSTKALYTKMVPPSAQHFLPRDVWDPIERFYEENVLLSSTNMGGHSILCRSSVVEDFLRVSINALVSVVDSWTAFPCKWNDCCISKNLKGNQRKVALISNYSLKRQIGSGGFGVVYLSSSSKFGDIAIKVDRQRESVLWEAEVHRMVIKKFLQMKYNESCTPRFRHQSIARLSTPRLRIAITSCRHWSSLCTR